MTRPAFGPKPTNETPLAPTPWEVRTESGRVYLYDADGNSILLVNGSSLTATQDLEMAEALRDLLNGAFQATIAMPTRQINWIRDVDGDYWFEFGPGIFVLGECGDTLIADSYQEAKRTYQRRVDQGQSLGERGLTRNEVLARHGIASEGRYDIP